MNKMFFAGAVPALLAACAVGPAYHRPQTPAVEPRNVDAHFTAAAPNAAWWGQFGDPVLADLEARALADNLDLHIAIARVRSARAAFNQAQYDYAPHVQADASYARSKQQQPAASTSKARASDSMPVGRSISSVMCVTRPRPPARS